MSAWAKRVGQGWHLAIHVQPGARRNEIAGLHGDALKVRVTAPPIEGQANAALAAFLAEALGLPRKTVSVIRGASSRHKTVLVATPDADPARLFR